MRRFSTWTAAALLLIHLQLTQTQFNAALCGATKGCYHLPRGCEKKNACIVEFSYQIIGESVRMELVGKPAYEDGYVAVAFSKDNKIGDDMVVYCARIGEAIKSGLAYSKVLPNGKPSFEVMKPHKVQLPLITDEIDGTIYCRIAQVLNPTGDPRLYNLDEKRSLYFYSGSFSVENGKFVLDSPHHQYMFYVPSLSLKSITGPDAISFRKTKKLSGTKTEETNFKPSIMSGRSGENVYDERTEMANGLMSIKYAADPRRFAAVMMGALWWLY